MSHDLKASSLSYSDLQPQDFLAALEILGFRCDRRFLALNSYENRVYQVGIERRRRRRTAHRREILSPEPMER